MAFESTVNKRFGPDWADQDWADDVYGTRFQASEAPSGGDDVRAKVIKFHARDFLREKVKSRPRDRRGKVIEFPQEKSASVTKTGKLRELDEVSRTPVFYPGCF